MQIWSAFSSIKQWCHLTKKNLLTERSEQRKWIYMLLDIARIVLIISSTDCIWIYFCQTWPMYLNKKVRLNVQTSCTVEKRQRLIAGELGSCGTCFILWIDGSNISNRDDIWSNAHFALTWCGFSDLEQSRTICTMWFSLQWTQGILLHC